MGGLGGGLILDVTQDVAVSGSQVIEVNQTTEVVRIISGTSAPTVIGMAGGYQDRLLLVVNVSGAQVTFVANSASAKLEEQLRGGGTGLLDGESMFWHYHIGTRGWWSLMT